MRLFKSLSLVLSVFVCAAAAAQSAPGMVSEKRFATDAYPGFDKIDKALEVERKTPRWFSWLNGPKMSTAVEQFAWAQECEKGEKWSKACKAYDALVRQWPSSPEAVKAQLRIADITLVHLDDCEEAFEAYRYLLDFYSAECDYNGIGLEMYRIAELMRERGKTVVFFHFDNTVDVRRAYEALVVRCPGAAFASKALLTIASLREDEGAFDKSVEVYETLRNIYPDDPEARVALRNEGEVRMRLIREHEYNRSRAMDTVSFLRLALASNCDDDDRAEFEQWLAEARGRIEAEAFLAAKFYDSRTRTKRSAINAYERYLNEFPQGAHAEEARTRLEALRSANVETNKEEKK